MSIPGLPFSLRFFRPFSREWRVRFLPPRHTEDNGQCHWITFGCPQHWLALYTYKPANAHLGQLDLCRSIKLDNYINIMLAIQRNLLLRLQFYLQLHLKHLLPGLRHHKVALHHLTQCRFHIAFIIDSPRSSVSPISILQCLLFSLLYAPIMLLMLQPCH
jgi:hypothetical protein